MQLEQVAGAVEDQHRQFTPFRSQIEAITSSVSQLAASVEALKVKPIPRQHEDSSDGLRRAKGVNLHPLATNLQNTDGMKLGRKERAFTFIAEYQRTHEGAEPTLPEIQQAVGCASGSASNYRSDYRKLQEAHRGELAAMAGASNGHSLIEEGQR